MYFIMFYLFKYWKSMDKYINEVIMCDALI